ncbi:hypothetical protein [Kribbella lupini]|uniref:Uncharacterized protein n=1 Tax=Kribbella lupini TaxID=291602 RepID=A0ABN2BX79_9ACTN
MSTPNEGPETAGRPQSLSQDSLQALSSLTPAQQEAMNHVVNAVKTVAPMINAVARGIQVIRQTMARLSQRAVQLASSARSMGQAAVGSVRQTATNTREATSNRASELSQQASDAVGRARDGAVNARDWTVDQAVGLTQRAAEGLNAAGRGAANAGRAVADAGRTAVAAGQDLAGRAAAAGRQGLAAGQSAAGQAVAAGQAAAGRAGRWFNQQISRGAAKASATFAGIADRRNNGLTSPDQKLQKRDVLLAQKAAELFTSPDNQRAAKAAELAAFIQNAYGTDQKVSLEKPGGPEQSVDAGARTTAATHEMAWVLKGTAPATEIHSGGTPAAPDASSNGEQTGRHAKKEGPTQSGQSRD